MKRRNMLLLGAGVGLVGLYYAFGKKSGPTLGPGMVDPSVTPVVPAHTSLALLGEPLSLKQGQYYRGRLDLRANDLPPFRAEADEVELGKGLSALGFQDVRVYMNEGELPAGWPADARLNVGTNTRWFVGQWGGLSMKLPRPSRLSLMWPTSSPQLASARARGA